MKKAAPFLFGFLLLLIIAAAPPSPLQRNPFTTNVYPASILGGQDFLGSVQVAGFTNQALAASSLAGTDSGKKEVSVTVTAGTGIHAATGSGTFSILASNAVTALNPNTPVSLDFSSTVYQTVSITSAVTFASANLLAGRAISIKILCDTTNRALTFPAWIFIGTAAPTVINSNKTAVLSLTSFAAADGSVVAAYAVQP